MDDESLLDPIYIPLGTFDNFWFYAILAAMIIFTYFVIRGIKEICFETITPNLYRLHAPIKRASYCSAEHDKRNELNHGSLPLKTSEYLINNNDDFTDSHE